ncbi:MAG: 4Fe-4S dicluster domain-containing protein [Polyangiaceae bacterium]
MEDHPWRGPRELKSRRAAPCPEFPPLAAAPPEVTRRSLLQLLGASAALASASGCSRGPAEDIVPYVNQPPDVTPAVPTQYATAMTIGGYGVGMIVESHEGRPTKAEGNPAHPASAGALGTFEQASVLSLYDPARASSLTYRGEPSTWDAFVSAVTADAPAGKHVHLLMEPTSAPHLVDLIERVRARGDVIVHFDVPLSRAQVWNGSKLAFGRAIEPHWHFARADVVLALDADFLGMSTSPAAWARDWAKRRRIQRPEDPMSRLYVAEPRLSVTGMAADERLRIQAREVRTLAADVLSAILALPDPAHAFGGPAAPAVAAVDRARQVARARSAAPSAYADWVRAVARDLERHRGSSLVLAGDGQPPEVHALAHAMNDWLGNSGTTVTYAPSAIFEAGQDSHGLDALVRAIDAGDVAALVVIGGNPVYTAARSLDLTRRLRSIATSAYVGSYENETASACSFFVPEAHFLESWSDVRALDGTPSIVQPLIRPLGAGKTAGQVLAAFVGRSSAKARDLVEEYWRQSASGDFAGSWRRALTRGIVADMGETPTVTAVRMDWDAVARELAVAPVARVPIEIVYFADSKVYDGRFADNAWLQELADPVTKLTWDNAALISPATSSRTKLATSDLVDIEVRGQAVRAPVLVVPGMADDVVSIALGYGQTSPGRLPHGVGADAYRLRDPQAPWFDEARLTRASGSFRLALTQEHWSMEGRPIVLRRTVDEYRRDPRFAVSANETPRRLYLLRPNGKHQWAMTIDLNACTGCSACVVACMAENNIPVVGKLGVANSREMQWIRIDRYFLGSPNDPKAVVQPMLCQHCEAAPCEYVCPVNATVHSDDGLNEMVYNRCVGTRFCNNNCPYKVRRFNFFNYNVDKPPTLKLAMNPDVTVRARGVMEKCSYCVQRIREAEIRSRREQRGLQDGEIVTACQQTCPTGAIVFGDIADPTTRVSESYRNPRLYQVLEELGTLPRTRYLARVVNPNPELARS